MSSPGLRFPAALQVFPTLRNWRSIRPRRIAEVPIGNTGQVPDRLINGCLRHLYHDIGVLVFSGLTTGQIRRVGDILQHVVNSGGPGKMITMVEWTEKSRSSRVTELNKDDIFEAVDVAHAGIVKPQSILRIADKAFREHITEKIDEAGLDKDKIQLRDRHILIRGIPSPKGVIHNTVNGSHRLSVDAFTSLKIDRRFGLLSGEMELYTVGKGEYVGAARIDYQLQRINDVEKTMKPIFAHQEFNMEEDDATEIRSLARRVVKLDILKELWRLEAETYGPQADRLVNYNKVGLRNWRVAEGLHQPEEGEGEADERDEPRRRRPAPRKAPLVW